MSLKAFHIAFIALSALLALGFAVWEVKGFAEGAGVGSLILGIVSLLSSVGLVVYGVRFMRKLKHVRLI